MKDQHYCKHGTYIGDPYGPDYMCHWCEMGIEPPPPPKWEIVETYIVTPENYQEVLARFIADNNEAKAAGYRTRTGYGSEPNSWTLEVSKT